MKIETNLARNRSNILLQDKTLPLQVKTDFTTDTTKKPVGPSEPPHKRREWLCLLLHQFFPCGSRFASLGVFIYLPFPVGHVALQQQLGLEAEFALLGLGREVLEPLVLQALRGAHPAAAGESGVRARPPLPQCPVPLC